MTGYCLTCQSLYCPCKAEACVIWQLWVGATSSAHHTCTPAAAFHGATARWCLVLQSWGPCGKATTCFLLCKGLLPFLSSHWQSDPGALWTDTDQTRDLFSSIKYKPGSHWHDCSHLKHSSTHRGASDGSESSLGAGWGCGVVLGQGHVLACCPGASAPRLAPALLVTRDSWAPAETRPCSALAKTAIWEQLLVLALPSWPCPQCA